MAKLYQVFCFCFCFGVKKKYSFLIFFFIFSDPKSKNSQPWTITRSLHPWTEGKPLFSRGDVSVLPERKGENPLVLFEGEEWEILESSISISELRVLFLCSSSL